MFAPFSLEVYGAWGPPATDFFGQASAHIRNYRDLNFFHWSEASFRRCWSTALATNVARGAAGRETPTADTHTTIHFS